MRRRDWFDWHSWLGLTAGLMLFVICWSGTVAVFSHEIDWLLNPALRAQPVESAVPFAEAKAAVEAARPDWEVWEVNAPRYRGFAMEVLAKVEPDVTHRVYVDPVTLEVLGDTSYLNVQRFFRSFHMALFQADFVYILGIPIGYFIVLLFVFPLLASAVMPLIFYKRWWRGFFKLTMGKGAKVFWSDFHKLTGLWSLWFVLLLCLTSFWYLAEWFIPGPTVPEAPQMEMAEKHSTETLITRAEAAFPELEVKSLGYYAAADNMLYVSGHDGTVLTRGRAHIVLDMRTGEVINLYHQGRSGLVARLMETVDVLHFGTFGKLWSQTLYFIFGLFLSGMCLTGAYLHAMRQKRKRPHGTRPAIIGAYAVTVGCLGLAMVAGCSEVQGYGRLGAWPEVTFSVTCFLVIWCISTLAALTIWMRALR
ncbi:MAG: hypothetical protein GC152_06585 [Alphaproteobacteria bacterium]|nr:hypothetical protein [Alphaproteobacteria bacterium]